MKKLMIGLILVLVSGCAALKDQMKDPVVKVGMSETELVKAMGKPTEIKQVAPAVKVFYWAQHNMYTGQMRAVAYVTRDGAVVDEPTQVADRIPAGAAPRYWD